MARKKTGPGDVDWGFKGPRDRTFDEFTSLAKATKLRTLLDMSEREIRALERFYGCSVQRPDRLKRTRRATGRTVVARS
jgi:hypothetical protein